MYLGYTLIAPDPPTTILYLARPNHRAAFVFWRFMVIEFAKKGCTRLETKYFREIYMILCRMHIWDISWVHPTHRTRFYTWPGPITGLLPCFCDWRWNYSQNKAVLGYWACRSIGSCAKSRVYPKYIPDMHCIQYHKNIPKIFGLNSRTTFWLYIFQSKVSISLQAHVQILPQYN